MALPSDKHARALGDKLQELSDFCEGILVSAVASGAALSAVELAKRRAAIAAAVAKFQVETGPVTQEVIVAAYERAARLVSDAPGPQDQAVTKLLADEVQGKLADASVSIGRRAEDGLRQVALDEIATGGREGESVAQMRERVVKRLDERGLLTSKKDARLVRLIGKDGKARNYNAQKYAEMLVRTASRDAHSRGIIQRSIDEGYDLVTVSTHVGGTDDELCAPYDGETFSLNGTTPGYDVLDEVPPFHPNCLHVLLPGPVDGLG
jgi:hypothetical protein